MAKKPTPPIVEIMIGSKSDRSKVEPAIAVFNQLQIPWILTIMSAHRHDHATHQRIKDLRDGSSIKFIIAAAGMAADLPGAIAAGLKGKGIQVIGVALSSTNFPDGMDAVLNIIRMPKGIPLVCAGIDEAGATNAALFAAEGIAMNNPLIWKNLNDFHKKAAESNPPQIAVECGGGAEEETTTVS